MLYAFAGLNNEDVVPSPKSQPTEVGVGTAVLTKFVNVLMHTVGGEVKDAL